MIQSQIVATFLIGEVSGTTLISKGWSRWKGISLGTTAVGICPSHGFICQKNKYPHKEGKSLQLFIPVSPFSCICVCDMPVYMPVDAHVCASVFIYLWRHKADVKQSSWIPAPKLVAVATLAGPCVSQATTVSFCVTYPKSASSVLHMTTSLSYLFRKLSKVLNFYVANAEDPSKTELLFAALKALKYLFRFIIQSRVLYLR